MRFSEEKRIETVNQFDQLDFDNNKELCDLVALAVEIFDAPIAMITLMGEDVQLIKCRLGISLAQTKREESFCKYLIKSKNVIIIPDATLDERFRNIPAVTGEFAIRFYAGAPLITTSGCHLGSFCLLDKKPREFSKKQIETFTVLAKQAMTIMELQMGLKVIGQQNIELKCQKEKTVASERKLRAFFNSSGSCHTLIDKNLKILDFNSAMAVFTKKLYRKKIEAGKDILFYINSSYKDEFIGYIKNAFAGKQTNKEVLINDGKGSEWWNISFMPIKDENGDIISVANSATNINEQKQQLIEIKDQNRLLLRIAYIQSHEYRKPVASIMGLMNVIKANNYKASKKSFMLMEHAVNDLDHKIKDIVNSIEYKFSTYAIVPL